MWGTRLSAQRRGDSHRDEEARSEPTAQTSVATRFEPTSSNFVGFAIGALRENAARTGLRLAVRDTFGESDGVVGMIVDVQDAAAVSSRFTLRVHSDGPANPV